MNNKPKIKLPQTAAVRISEILGWMAIVTWWLYVIINYGNLPEKIPVHFDLMGMPDRWGNKLSILALPILGTVLFTGLTVLNRFPHIFNYPVEITTENALIQYTNATAMIRFLKFSVVLVLGFITIQTMRITSGRTDKLSSWLLPVTVLLLLVPSVYFIIRSFRIRK